MKRSNLFVVALVLVAFLALVGNAFAVSPANGTYDLSWNVIAGGGGRSASGSYVLEGTVGQPVVGAAQSGGYELGAGFWYGIPPVWKVSIPFAARMLTAGP